MKERSEPEVVPLTGGNLTQGIVRVGDTVRRPCSESSVFTAKLLTRLQELSFKGAPTHHGIDDQSRDILSYIPGETKWRPLSDEQVQAGGRLLRAFHDASRQDTTDQQVELLWLSMSKIGKEQATDLFGRVRTYSFEPRTSLRC